MQSQHHCSSIMLARRVVFGVLCMEGSAGKPSALLLGMHGCSSDFKGYAFQRKRVGCAMVKSSGRLLQSSVVREAARVRWGPRGCVPRPWRRAAVRCRSVYFNWCTFGHRAGRAWSRRRWAGKVPILRVRVSTVRTARVWRPRLLHTRRVYHPRRAWSLVFIK